MFIDGKEACPSEPSIGVTKESPEPLRIGSYTDSGNVYNLDGLIDEVRIYNEGLSSSQIKKLYVEGAEKRGLVIE